MTRKNKPEGIRTPLIEKGLTPACRIVSVVILSAAMGGEVEGSRRRSKRDEHSLLDGRAADAEHEKGVQRMDRQRKRIEKAVPLLARSKRRCTILLALS
jgi:hypothetical protein